MDWTMVTFGTVGNDALDAGDCLRTCWTLGSAAGEVIRERLRVADRRSCEVLNPCVGAGETPALRPGDGVRATAGRGAGEVIRERLRNAIWRSCEVLNPCVGAGETPAPQSGDGARDGTEDGGARVFHTGNYWLF